MVFALLSASASAADIENGRRIALQWCANCHLVSEGQQQPAIDGIPSFASLARNPEMSESRIRGALMRPPHAAMPNFQLSRQEMDDLLAFMQEEPRR